MSNLSLIDKINEKKSLIGIIGLGYVGLPIALRFIEENFKVIGFDIDSEKIDLLKNGKSYIEHISSESITSAINTKFSVTRDFSRVTETDVLIICVPTPLSKQREPDMTFIINTLESISPYIHKNHLISLESTTYPGTTEEILKPTVESTGLKVGIDISLVFSPEREDPGNLKFNTRNIPKVVAGITQSCLEVGLLLYSKIVEKVIPVSSPRTAEMVKLLENIYRAVNIGLVNEMKIVADKMGIDIHEVIEAAATKPFGFTAYYPGPGLGGHCIPIDPFYLTWKAREYGIHTRFIELAGEVNNGMPEWVVNKLTDALNTKRKSINGSLILVLGIAYKKNIDDVRESPSIKLMELLQDKGAIISYSDPHVSVFPKMREHHFDMKSTQLDAEVLQKFDCVLLATDHDNFDYDLIKTHAQLIIDTRGKFKDKDIKYKLIKA